MDLIVDNLAVSLGHRRVLENVDARFRPGRVTAVLGPNGSGKTTLVKTLAGLLDPDAGHVKLGKTRIAALTPRDRARRIGYLPQDARVHWNIAVGDLVALGRLPHRAPFAGPSAADAAAVDAALEATGTARFARRRADELSGGERARVLLARVLAGTPEWLLADEPLASLDPIHQLDLIAALRRLAEQGMGVVLVMHDLIQAARAADDVLLLKKGQVVAHGPVREALTHGPLREAFGVEVMVLSDELGFAVPVPIGRARAD